MGSNADVIAAVVAALLVGVVLIKYASKLLYHEHVHLQLILQSLSETYYQCYFLFCACTMTTTTCASFPA